MSLSLKIELTEPKLSLASSYLEFFKEMQGLGEKVWDKLLPIGSETTAEFLTRLLEAHRNPPEGMVAETTYWAVVHNTNTVVGRISIRHRLNENLKLFGGNIGYEVRPTFRQKGVASEMLRQALLTTTAKSIGRLLLTCAPSNTASIKTILKNGGVFEKITFVEKIDRETCYYWINLNRK